MNRKLKALLVVLAVAIAGIGGATVASAGNPGTPLRYHAFAPYRAYDSRTTNGGTTLANKNAPNFAATICGAPGAEAFAINLTVDQPEGPGYLSVAPANAVSGGSSALNFLAGQVVANFAITAADANGCFRVYTTVRTHIIVDITGWFAP